jgi:hypothetical protein
MAKSSRGGKLTNRKDSNALPWNSITVRGKRGYLSNNQQNLMRLQVATAG